MTGFLPMHFPQNFQRLPSGETIHRNDRVVSNSTKSYRPCVSPADEKFDILLFSTATLCNMAGRYILPLVSSSSIFFFLFSSPNLSRR